MTAKLFADVKPGDRLFRARKGHRQNDPVQTDWVVVTKVGRKWVEHVPEGAQPAKWNTRRFDVETGQLNSEWGGTGSIHRSEEAWRAWESAKETWRNFRMSLAHRDLPPGVTEADIRKAAELLKIEVNP